MSLTSIRVLIGRVVLMSGILILLFIPYLLWGTGLMTARSQQVLRTELHSVLRQSGSDPPLSPTPRHVVPGGAPQVASDVTAPPIGSPIGTIHIPAIGLSMVVVEGTGTAQLELGPGHYRGTPLPGEAGNVAVAGHRTTYLHPFYNLNDLVPGDTVDFTTLQGFFDYRVTGSQVVSPSDVSVVAPKPGDQLTLTTCTPLYSASQRLVVHAVLEASSLAPHGAAVGSNAGLRPVASSEPRSWPTAIGWAIAVTLLTSAIWYGLKRTRRTSRWLLAAGGTVAWLAVVALFFQAVAPLLPASY
ncbi:MAG: class E sortase [Acidimicrobiales bacterium]